MNYWAYDIRRSFWWLIESFQEKRDWKTRSIYLRGLLGKFWPHRIQYGIENLIAYFPVIWADRDWDHSFFLFLMEFKLRRMAEHFRKYGHHTGAKKDVANILEAAALCKRIREENYYGNDRSYKQVEAMFDQDLERLGMIFRKHLREWWD